MQGEYYKEYSPALGRDMEWKVYGYGGRPVLYIPCQNGRFYDFENYQMLPVWEPWISSGQVTVFTPDSLDAETWSNEGGDPGWRIWRHEQWITHLTEELVPRMKERTGALFVIAAGCSLGAAHAANLYFRRPDLFDGLLALSGVYTAEFSFGSFMNPLVYQNSPVHYLRDLSPDDPRIHDYNLKRAVFCTGQGPWECPDYTRTLDQILAEKQIHARFDYWGYDVCHDWPWWYKQTQYFLPWILQQN